MPPLRVSGSFRRFYYEGERIHLDTTEPYDAIRVNGFRSIDGSGSEAESSGWVSPWDPTGVQMEPEDLRVGDHLVLHLRMDKKRVPPALLKIYCAAEERAELQASGAVKLSRNQRKQIKDRVEADLLERALPNLSLYLLIFHPASESVLFTGTSEKVADAMMTLFRATFGGKLRPAAPGPMAEKLAPDHEHRSYIERTGPLLLAPKAKRIVGVMTNGHDRESFESEPSLDEDDGEGVVLRPVPRRDSTPVSFPSETPAGDAP
ncbi:MAG: recombination-associated protein RdgC [Planctomycetes bacterium]|nr:recombination-associated protein RdgC [Planctomycetota bacterium]